MPVIIFPIEETVNHPSHYNMYKDGEVIDLVELLTFNRGNAVKYITRAAFKGNEVEDLKKALWYLEREIDMVVHTGMPVPKANPVVRELARVFAEQMIYNRGTAVMDIAVSQLHKNTTQSLSHAVLLIIREIDILTGSNHAGMS